MQQLAINNHAVHCFFPLYTSKRYLLWSQRTSKDVVSLHGVVQRGSSLSFDEGDQDLESSLEDHCDFIFAQTPEAGNVWIGDPLGVGGDPTTDPALADHSVSSLDNLTTSGPAYRHYALSNQLADGPFAGILGYPPGSAFAAYYAAGNRPRALPLCHAVLRIYSRDAPWT